MDVDLEMFETNTATCPFVEFINRETLDFIVSLFSASVLDGRQGQTFATLTGSESMQKCKKTLINAGNRAGILQSGAYFKE
jgi:hypothetical protein